MAQVHLLGAGVSYDTDKQVVEVNQKIQMNGYSDDQYVVYGIEKGSSGLIYKLINLRTKKFGQCNLIRPLSQKFGIGYYFDDENPQFMDSFEVTILHSEAEQNKKAEQEEIQRKQQRDEQLSAIGRERLQNLIPADTKAVIVARLHEDDSDSMTDYFGYNVIRTVILGFSTHTRDIFSEMRKHAGNFEETAYLSEYNEDYEHREKYSMGEGYYLGKSGYSGWIIEKEKYYKDRESIISAFALIAGEECNICVKGKTGANTQSAAIAGDFLIVDYSEKALAVFGDTRPMREQLKELGGRFNPKLTHEGEKKSGWIFSKSKEQELRELLTDK